jgi:hypothetical protein
LHKTKDFLLVAIGNKSSRFVQQNQSRLHQIAFRHFLVLPLFFGWQQFHCQTVNSGTSNYGLAVTVFVRFKLSGLSTSRLMISIISYCSLETYEDTDS